MLVSFLTLKTATARNRPIEHDRIARFETRDLRANLPDNARAFMTHHERFTPRHRIKIGVANARSFQFDQKFIALRGIYIDCVDLKPTRSGSNGGTCFHHLMLLSFCAYSGK